ncbi:tn3 transposase DDE domain protein [Brucella grignonensis]|uniref:Tn3 transposase DDE domain protein n=1 Tax=Brucella grignonensis TaxID=94627 RepID=A0A256EZF2_9HYPH|nr:tn3 transposase DDE domain protein [Brucella grignonensis]
MGPPHPRTANIFRLAVMPRRSATSTLVTTPIPGAKFYRFTSDQYGAFYIVAMNANASEAIYVLDGLLYHGSELVIETHYVDTGGVSDMSFALCHLVGFQLVPRLRGLKDRKLYLFPGDTPPENLASLVGEPVNVERIKANWNDILRLVTTIRSGQVRPSTLLAKLSAFPRQNGLALALRDLGRINRSIFFCPSGGRIRRCAETPLLASTRAKPRTPWLALYSSIVSESYATVPSRASSTGRPV